MARSVVCGQCGRPYHLTNGFRGRVACPHCGAVASAGGRSAAAPMVRPAAAQSSAAPALPKAPPPSLRRTWPPPRDQRIRAWTAALARRFAGPRGGLAPYLILLAALAAALILFAVLAAHHAGGAPESESARPASQELTACA